MKFLKSLFLEDLTRKFLALGIALLIWWRVDAALERDRIWPFTIAVGSGAPSPHEILVDVPDGWLLLKPKPGEDVDIKFRGNDRDFQDFTSTLCGASVAVTISESSTQTNSEFQRKVEELDWQRKDLALSLLKHPKVVNADLNFVFVRKDSIDRTLEEAVLAITGAPADGYQIKRDQIEFTPNMVRIHGPFGIAENSLKMQTERTLFETLVIEDGEQGDVIRSIELSTEALNRGMWMEPESILVTVPIRRSDDVAVDWRPKQPITIGQAPDGLAWTVRQWPNEMWLASYEPVDGLPLGNGTDWRPTKDWLEENIQLVVHLNQIGEDAPDGYELYVDWIISDPNLMADANALGKLKNAITIWPQRPDVQNARTVVMSKPEGQ